MLLCSVGHWRDSEPSRELVCVGRQRRLAGRCLIIASCLQGFCFGRGAASEHHYRAIPEAALLLLTDGCVCVCVCVCVSAHIWGKIWPGGGGEVGKCGERSAVAQLVRPPLQPGAASDEPILSRPSLSCTCPIPKPSDLTFSDLTPRKKTTHALTHALPVSYWWADVGDWSFQPGQRSLAMALNQMPLKEPRRWLQGLLWWNHKCGDYFCTLKIRHIIELLRHEIRSWFNLQYLQKPGCFCVEIGWHIFRICPFIMSDESVYTGRSTLDNGCGQNSFPKGDSINWNVRF